jgi:hypothetical protein
MKRTDKKKLRGVYFLSKNLQREYDFRLGKNSYVGIVSKKYGFNLTQIRQMLDRGDRT